MHNTSPFYPRHEEIAVTVFVLVRNHGKLFQFQLNNATFTLWRRKNCRENTEEVGGIILSLMSDDDELTMIRALFQVLWHSSV